MKESLRDFLIGLCAIVATAGLVSILFLFDEIDTGNGWTFSLRTSHAVGIMPGSQVTLNGVTAGKITQVELVDDPTLPVEMKVRINNGVIVPEDVTFRVKDSLLGSSARLAMMAPDWSSDQPRLSPGAKVRVADIPSKMMSELGEQIDARLGNLLASWSAVGESLSTLLARDSNDEASITGTIRRINSLLVATSAWVDNPTLLNNATDLMQKLPVMMDRTISASEELKTVLQTMDRNTDVIGTEIAQTTRNLRELLNSSNKLIIDMQQGEGTIGEMIKNPDLYRNLEAASNRLEQVLIDIQLLVEQVREEGVGPLF
ncbi:MAG: MlaD family protein [Phycisphaerales bacterium]|nr:MlaD family protein [Phycisphaerales bacterium]